jgi:hypothetical protein
MRKKRKSRRFSKNRSVSAPLQCVEGNGPCSNFWWPFPMRRPVFQFFMTCSSFIFNAMDLSRGIEAGVRRSPSSPLPFPRRWPVTFSRRWWWRNHLLKKKELGSVIFYHCCGSLTCSSSLFDILVSPPPAAASLARVLRWGGGGLTWRWLRA